MKATLIASDHAGLGLKMFLKEQATYLGVEFRDLGCDNAQSCDYPPYAQELCRKIRSGEFEKGVLICGTGIGMSITANRFTGIRGALCANEFLARMSRAHNDSNVLILGGRVIGAELALAITKAWIDTPFDGGRHSRRLELIDQ